jgi:two-component system, LuxR family, response regulator FixJ
MRTSKTTSEPSQTVFVVDDDEGMRKGLRFLLESTGYDVETLDSAQAFLDFYRPSMRGCVLLDVRMPGMSGLELQEHLRSENIAIPVIIVTAHANVPMAVDAMQNGAFDFIEKPFEGSVLLGRVRQAIAHDARHQVQDKQRETSSKRLNSLTPREREVMNLVVHGLLNKQIAGELGISMKTVENHRAKVMEKMKAESLAQLVRMTMTLVDDEVPEE